MLNLENLPNPSQFKLEDYPGIKPDTITEMFNAGRLDWLLSFFDFQARAKNRAESLALVYFHQMELYKKMLDEARGILPKETQHLTLGEQKIKHQALRRSTKPVEPKETQPTKPAPKVELLDL